MIEEIWKDIPNYEGLYQASTFGRIRSVSRKVKNFNGKVNREKKVQEKLLKPNTTANGYLKVSLSKNGKARTFLVHLLVARTFLGFSELQIDHIDCNKKNNNINNLEYVTAKENNSRAIRNNLRKPKENKINQYDLTNNFIRTWLNCGIIERELKLDHSNIIKCCNGKRNQCGGYIWKYNNQGQ